MIRRPTRLALLAGASVAIACSSGPTSASTLGVLPLGTWGGDSAGLIVSDTSMHLHIACTFGDASGRIPVAGDGTFDVTGTYMLHAYPIAVGPSDPARFTGKVVGSTAIVTATVNDTAQHQTVVRGPVVVTLGTTPKLGPCPICARPVITTHTGLSLGRFSDFLRGLLHHGEPVQREPVQREPGQSEPARME